MPYREKIAILGVVFPKVEAFIDEYLQSLEEQTVRCFDVIIINDGFDAFYSFKAKYNSLNIKEIEYRGTPAEIREFGINYIRNQGYQYVVFTDSDDYFSRNRVEKSIELLEHYDIVVNDLTTVSDGNREIDILYLSGRLKNLSEINFDFISDKNIFGFSNTAMKMKSLTGKVIFDKNLIAVDWFLFSMLLMKNCSAVFTNEAVTFYRIYEGNVAGLSSATDRKKIEKGINVKRLHYKNLSLIDDTFKGVHGKFDRLNSDMENNEYKSRYVEKVKLLGLKNTLWWEDIKLPEEIVL